MHRGRGGGVEELLTGQSDRQKSLAKRICSRSRSCSRRSQLELELELEVTENGFEAHICQSDRKNAKPNTLSTSSAAIKIELLCYNDI